MDFNVTENEKFIAMVSDSKFQSPVKKLPLVKLWYITKEYPQLPEKPIKVPMPYWTENLCQGRFSLSTNILHSLYTSTLYIATHYIQGDIRIQPSSVKLDYQWCQTYRTAALEKTCTDTQRKCTKNNNKKETKNQIYCIQYTK